MLKKLWDKRWRLTSGMIYKIKEKDGVIRPFIPNAHQLQFFRLRMLYNKIVIPKSRQLGMSTAEQIDDFDDALFMRNITIGIIADTKDTARMIFTDKIKVLWDNLPPRLKYVNWVSWKTNWVLNTDTTNQLSFENTWSTIYVGTSFRWGTLQRLHVSELWKIGSKYPMKAREIVTGWFEAVWPAGKITVESTSMGAEGPFYDIAKAAYDLDLSWGEPGPMEFKLLFLPRFIENTYRSNDTIMFTLPEVQYFNDLRDKWIYLDKMQMTWYALKRRVLKEDMFREYPSTFEEAFMLITEWSYYEKEINQARTSKRICRTAYDPNLLVHTAWDLWWAWGWDDTSIRFFQVYWHEIRIIDYWEWNRMSLVAIIEQIIKTKGYKYWKHFWPHDMMVTEYSSWVTRYDTALKQWIEFTVLEKNAIKEGIDNVRNIFPKCYFDEEKTKTWIQHLSRYRRSFNEKHWVYTDQVEKNGSQHAADAFRYLATWILDIMVEDRESFVYNPNYNY